MALTKPNAVPNWASTSTNVVQPPAAKRDQGWLFQEMPPSSFENWRARTVGEWLSWTDERFADYSVLGGTGIAMTDPNNPTDNVFAFVKRQIGSVFAHSIIVEGTSPIEINAYPSSNVIDFVMNGVREARLNGVSSYLGVGNASDSIQLYGKGDIKSILYGGSAIKQIRWQESTRQFSFYADSFTPSFYISDDEVFAQVARTNQLKFTDDIYIQNQSTRLEFILEPGSHMTYFRNSNIWEYEINGGIPLNIESDKLYPGDPDVALGDDGQPWGSVYSENYYIEQTTTSQPVHNKYDRVSANSITACAHVEAGGLTGTPFNIASVTALGVGFFDVVFTEPLSSNPVIVGTAGQAFTNVAWNSLTSTKIQFILFNTQTNALVNEDFSIMVVG